MNYQAENPARKINKINRALRLFCAAIALSTYALPSATANGTSAEIFQPSTPACDVSLPPSDQTYSVDANCTVMGDVRFGPSPDDLINIFNSNEDTGFSVTLKRPSQVLALFGADASSRPVNDLIRQQLVDGCGQPGGCDSALHVAWGRYDDAHPASEGTARVQPECNFDILEGQAKPVSIPAGCTVSGDIAMSGLEGGPFVALFDNDPNTGLIVRAVTAAFARADFGASVSDRDPGSLTNQAIISGCGQPDGCAKVDQYDWATHTDQNPPPYWIFVPLLLNSSQ